jgi:hypothetical protein
MKYIEIKIEGEGCTVVFVARERGSEALVEKGPGKRLSVARIDRDDDSEKRFEQALLASRYVYGLDRHGRAAGTNSMIHDVMNVMERLAGC